MVWQLAARGAARYGSRWLARRGAAALARRTGSRAVLARARASTARSALKTGLKRSAAVAGFGALAAGATSSMKKRKTKTSNIESKDPGSTTHSKNTIIYKPMKDAKLHKMLGNKAIYEVISPITLLGTNALQCATGDGLNAELANVYNGPGIGTLYNKAATAYVTMSDAGTANQYIGQAYNTSSSQSKKFALQSARYTITLSNQAPSTAKVTIYVLQCKNSNSFATNPWERWNEGLSETKVGAGSLTADLAKFPQCKPTSSKSFNVHYKIVKKVNVDLHAGADHEHSFAFKAGRVIDTQYANDFAEIRGITHKFMIVARGSVADSANTKNAGIVTTTDVKIVGTVKQTYVSNLVNFWPRVRYEDNQLNSNPGQLWEINEDGAPVNTELDVNYA